MSDLVPATDIEQIVGAPRHTTMHIGRAVSSEETVYILHSQECRDSGIDLRECPLSIALDLGIELPSWTGYEDRPVALGVIHERLVPLVDLAEGSAGTAADATYEHHFVTNDGAIFNLIEGEDGGTYWGYDHVKPETFIAEVNKWLTHCGIEDDDLAPPTTKVEHLWARANGETGDFELREPTMTESDAELFPVTRVWL